MTGKELKRLAAQFKDDEEVTLFVDGKWVTLTSESMESNIRIDEDPREQD